MIYHLALGSLALHIALSIKQGNVASKILEMIVITDLMSNVTHSHFTLLQHDPNSQA